MEEASENIKIKSLKQKKNAYKGSLFFLCLVFFALISIDQISKQFAGHIFKNSAFAFSIPLSAPLMFAIYFFVLLAMVVFVAKNYQRFAIWQTAAWLLIFAGSTANIGERIYFGFVRDFIYIHFYKWTGIYNLADGYIIVGILILLFSRNKNSKLQIPNNK